ncbi:hypothetical protein BESB_000910 [Besnoitia besnoiti]|uniref:MerC mercury resistance protein n=1 Tax=Besnoitia besnoiti TaxID=94643 RepID=A0A2A9MIL3_BESBE|nr:hypothetical protein BESB_000910 [Besnoitia besnoiti]PFH37749.1 hypothetical protein BESB_000910 [Besnoitia besnoiti]
MAAVLCAVKNIRSWSLSDWSSFAAVLCAIDCTVLPALAALLPVVGLLGDSEGAHDHLHFYSHLAALYVVLPLGFVALVLNYLQHRRTALLVSGLVGLAIVFVTHCHDSIPLPHWLHWIAHDHALIGAVGSALLISTNYLSHKAIHGMDSASSHASCCASKGRCPSKQHGGPEMVTQSPQSKKN